MAALHLHNYFAPHTYRALGSKLEEVEGWPNNQVKLRRSLNWEARKTRKLRVKAPRETQNTRKHSTLFYLRCSERSRSEQEKEILLTPNERHNQRTGYRPQLQEGVSSDSSLWSYGGTTGQPQRSLDS